MKKLYQKNKFMLFLLLAVILVSACTIMLKNYNPHSKSADVSKVLTNKQWLEDVNYLDSTLTNFHPYLNENRTSFDKEINQLKKDIPKLNDSQITLRIMQIVAAIGDGHTSINLTTKSSYPIHLAWYGNDLKVDAVSKMYEKLLGLKIISINGIPIEKIINKIDTLVPHETKEFVKNQDVNYITNPEILKTFGFINNDNTFWAFEDNNKQTINMSMNPDKDDTPILGYHIDPVKASPSFFKGKEDFYGFWYKYIPEDKIFYFRYDICYDKTTRQSIGNQDYNSYPVFSDFSSKMEKSVEANNIDKFIIDLRYNPGGDSELIKPFIEWLSNNQKLNRKGKLFVVTGKDTFSGGVWAAENILDNTNAISIGEPTGGIVNCTGNIQDKILPNSQIKLVYSTKQFHISDKYKDQIIPDIFVHQSLDDIRLGIDDVYESVKKYEVNQ